MYYDCVSGLVICGLGRPRELWAYPAKNAGLECVKLLGEFQLECNVTVRKRMPSNVDALPSFLTYLRTSVLTIVSTYNILTDVAERALK